LKKEYKNLIIFNGQKHKIIDEESLKNLEKITKAILESGSKLSNQFRNHTPVFENSAKYLLKASADMKDSEVFSIFDKKMYLSLESVIITELIINKKKNLYLEKRDLYGRH